MANLHFNTRLYIGATGALWAAAWALSMLTPTTWLQVTSVIIAAAFTVYTLILWFRWRKEIKEKPTPQKEPTTLPGPQINMTNVRMREGKALVSMPKDSNIKLTMDQIDVEGTENVIEQRDDPRDTK
jgi:membrane protein implicated in regulation of membrane protease activity